MAWLLRLLLYFLIVFGQKLIFQCEASCEDRRDHASDHCGVPLQKARLSFVICMLLLDNVRGAAKSPPQKAKPRSSLAKYVHVL